MKRFPNAFDPRFSYPSVLLMLTLSVMAVYLNLVWREDPSVIEHAGNGFPFLWNIWQDYLSSQSDASRSFHLIPFVADIAIATVVVLSAGLGTEKLISAARKASR